MLSLYTMARGWESKSVESQIEDARKPEPKTAGESLDDLRKQRELEGLQSSRRRILGELKTTQSPVYRAALENALAHLEQQIGKLH